MATLFYKRHWVFFSSDIFQPQPPFPLYSSQSPSSPLSLLDPLLLRFPSEKSKPPGAIS